MTRPYQSRKVGKSRLYLLKQSHTTSHLSRTTNMGRARLHRTREEKKAARRANLKRYYEK